MAFKVLLVVLAISMLLTSGTERSDEVSPRGRSRLCLCSNRVLRLSSQDSEASSSASCEEMCTALNSKAGVFSSLSRHHLRSRRDVLNGNETCLFTRFRPDWKVKNIAVAFHRNENISVWFAEVSWSPFNGSSHLWSGYYLVYFTGNRMRSPIYCPVISKNQTSVNISSTEKVEMITLNISVIPKSLNSTIDLVIMDLDPYTSDNVNVHVTLPPYNVDPTDGENIVVTYASIVAGIVTGIILGAGLLRYCWCREKEGRYFPPEFTYHVFIIFQNKDSSWVEKELRPFLEKEHHMKCCIHYRDFTPGMPFTDSMAESVYKSFKIIAVFSSNFLTSAYCRHELDLSQYRLLRRRDDCLIIIRLDKTDPSKLPPALQKRNFIDYSDVLERPFWKSRLLQFLNCGGQGVSIEKDNNNSALEDSNEQNGQRQARAEFGRFNSTTSTATEISIVSLNEERLI